jgi:hypothetical protein
VAQKRGAAHSQWNFVLGKTVMRWEAVMQHSKTVIVAALALILASPLTSEPVQAQDPGRILRPLTTPFRMIVRGVPRARVSRAYRARASRETIRERRAAAREAARERREAARERREAAREQRETARENRPAATRGQIIRGVAATGVASFWPIGAPDAFEDMLGYALWPGDYGRQFWSHGPNDIMRAMTAPAAAFAADAGSAPRQRLTTALVTSANAAPSDRAICIARVKDQAMRPFERIDQTIRLTTEQQQGLNDLRTAIRAAIDDEAAACRGDLPATQPERLRAMIDGLWAMRYAEFRIRPALEKFYASLTDEQKAQLSEAPQTVGGNEAATATPAAICGEPTPAPGSPFDPIQRALQPTAEQQKSLQMLYGASMEMAQYLTSTCPTDNPSTPMARLGAASDRVMSLLHAAMNIEPILGQFYAGLSDQQRRRFNSAIR